MRIACPSCATEYEVPASRLPPGKMVRCARCGGEWLAVPEAEEDIPALEAAPPVTAAADVHAEPAALPAIAAMDRLASSPPPAPSPAGLIGAWVLTFVVLVGAAAATVAWREEIVRAWPPSSRILAPAARMVAAPAQTTGNRTD